MKTKFLTLIAVLFATLSAQAQLIEKQPVYVISEETAVTTCDSVEVVETEALESDFNIDFPFNLGRNKKKSRSVVTLQFMPNVSLGLVNVPTGGGMNPRFNTMKSWEMGIPSTVNIIYRPFENGPQFTLGFLGMQVKKIVSKQNFFFDIQGNGSDDRLDVTTYPGGSDKWSSSIQVAQFTNPVGVRQYFAKNVFVELSAALTFNVSVKVKNCYRLNGKKYKETQDFGNYRPLGCDLQMRMHVRDVDWYLKYTPTDMFAGGIGPKIRTLSFGFIL